MDLTDINKVASIKRIKTDAQKLKEKMSRESAKIIKLKVAQDMAYWVMQERLSGAQAEHERLQQNMLDVQMELEPLSTRYQDELRQRPETLNRLAGTRDICDALEEHAASMRGSLQCAAAARTALAASYDAAVRRVSAAHAQHATAMGSAAADNDRLRLSAEHGAQLAAVAESARRSAEAACDTVRVQMHDATARADEERVRCAELAERAASSDAALREMERTVVELRAVATRRELDSRAAEERAARDQRDLQKELEARAAALAMAEARRASLAEETARLRDANAVHEERAERVAEETALLRDALAAHKGRAEREAQETARLRDALAAHEDRAERAAKETARLRNVLAAHVERAELSAEETSRLKNALSAHEERAECAAEETARLRNALSAHEERAECAAEETARLRNALATQEECTERTAEETARLRNALAAHEKRAKRAAEETARLIAAKTNLENVAADLERKLETASTRNVAQREKIEGRDREARESSALAEAARREHEETRAAQDELAASLQAEREARAADAARADNQQRAAGAAAAEAERALASRASRVVRLMSEVAGEAEARTRGEAALKAARADLEACARARAKAEEETRAHDAELLTKEDELLRQMAIILELRSEKKRLQDTILDMQGTIDNIQKLMREPPESAAQAAPEATARREPPELDGENVLLTAPVPLAPQLPSQRSTIDDLLLQFLSDNSMDSTWIAPDPREGNGIFEALLAHAPRAPAHSSSPKRRRRPQVLQSAVTEGIRGKGAGESEGACAGTPLLPLPLPQLEAQLTTRPRRFFSTKRRHVGNSKKK